MSRRRLQLFSVVVIGMITVPNVAIPVGPARLRPIDILAVTTVLLALSFGPKFDIARTDAWHIFPLVAIFAVSILRIPTQQFAIGNSVVDSIEVLEVVFFYVAARIILSESDDGFVNKLLYYITIWTVASSALGIVIFALTGIRLVYIPVVVGLPVLSTFYVVTAYMRTSNLRYIAFLIVLLLRIIFTQTRSIWIAMAGAAVILLLIEGLPSVDKFRKELVSLSAVAVVSVTGALVSFPGLVDRVLSLVRGNQFLFARPVIYISSWQLFVENPFGVGLGNFTPALTEAARGGELTYPDWFIRIAGESIIQYSNAAFLEGRWGAHSDLVKMWVELGFVGGFLFILFWALIFKTVISSERTAVTRPCKYVLIYFAIQSNINSYLLNAGQGTIIALLLAMLVTSHLRITDTPDISR